MAGQTTTTQQTESSLDIVDGIVTLRLVWPDRPWTVNAQARQRSVGGQAVYNRLTAEWREHFRRLAKGAPAMLWCEITVTQELRNRSGFPDTCACVMAYKAALDGIVAAGVLPDDDPEHVRFVGFEPPIVVGRDALVLELVGPAA